MAKVKEMTSGPCMPLILNFALPLLLGNMLQQTYSLVDAAIVGQTLGINALAAVGAGSSVIFLILGFCNGCCGGFAIPVAQKFGARDYRSMRLLVNASLRIAAVSSVVIAIITSLMCPYILHWMQTPDEIFDDANIYLIITFAGIPATFFYNLLSSIIRALGDSTTPFWFLLFSTVLNIVLDLVCIMVLHWGVAGAAIATVTAQGVSALLCYVFMTTRFEVLKSQEGDGRLHVLKQARTLLSVGVPMGLQFSITAIGSIMLQSSNNALGAECISAFTAAMRIKMFCMTPLESLGMAMATFCGQNYGAGLPHRISAGIKSAIKLMLGYSAVMMVLQWTLSEQATMMFVAPSETAVIGYSARFLHVSVSFYPVLGTLCILRYSIQGAGYTKLAMFSGVSEMVARVLVSLFAVPVWKFWAVCFGDPTAWIFAVAFLVPAAIYVDRQLRHTLQKSPQS